MRDGQIIRPAGRISTIAEINEAFDNAITQDLGYRGDEPRRTWEADGPFRPDPGHDPVAAFAVVVDGLGVNTDATASFDDNQIEDYTWTWGDGNTHSTVGPTASHTYAGPGSYTIRLTVTDVTGESGWIEIPVEVAV